MSANLELRVLRERTVRVCFHALLDLDCLLDIGFDTNIRECDMKGVTDTIREIKELITDCGSADLLRGPPCEERGSTLVSKWYVDVPGAAVPEGPWVNVATFDSRDEALWYVQDMFGADDEGRVSLITEVHDGCDPNEEEDA